MVKIIHHFKNCLEKLYFLYVLESMYIDWMSLWKTVVVKYTLLCFVYCDVQEDRVDGSVVPVPSVSDSTGRRNVAWAFITKLPIPSSQTCLACNAQNTPKDFTTQSIIPSLLRLVAEDRRSSWVNCFSVAVL